MKWLEVSITLDGELAEAVADLFARYAPGGVALHSSPNKTKADPDDPVDSVDILAYLPADDQLPIRRKNIEEGLWHLGQIEPIPEPGYRFIQEADWAETWKANYHPIPIGRRLLILPAWQTIPNTDRIPLIIDPGLAFGTGTHPSTRLCLSALEDHLIPGQRVVDLGCGSGILSIAAAHLGAIRVQAFDIDKTAVVAARENAERNGVSDIVHVMVGSLSNLFDERRDHETRNHLLLANILSPTLEKMIAEGLAKAVVPGGLLILSGILDDQRESLLNLCEDHGIDHVETRSEKDWRALVLQTAE